MDRIDEKEFKAIFDEYYQVIRNFIFYKTGDIDKAEDIVQDVFLKIWEKRDTIIKETVKSLLYKITGNLLKNTFLHKKVELNFAVNLKKDVLSESPEFEMEMKEFDDKLQSAISGLSEKNRIVFLMNRIDGMTYNSIAESLSISVKAVEKRMNKALTFLRKKIEYKI